MKRFSLALLLGVVLLGCRRGDEVGDEDEIRAILESHPLFNVLDVIDGQPETTRVLTSAPQNWYRRVYRDSTVKNFNINVSGDSAYVVAKWYLRGEFRVITGFTYVSKPLKDVVERHAVFKKVNNRWRLTRITGFRLYPEDGVPAFTIDSVVVVGTSSGAKVFTTPFTFLDTADIFYAPGETVRVKVYVSLPDSVFGYVHHWKGRHHRHAMDYDSTGGYLIGYFTLTTNSGKYNAAVDLIQRGSLSTSSQTYLSEAWGFPYTVR